MACFGASVSLLQAITYFAIFVLSFFVCIPVGMVLRNFQGSCILYAQVVWNGRTIWPWSETSCDFVLYMTLAVCLFYAFFMGVYSMCVAVPKRFPFAKEHAENIKDLETHERSFLVHAVNPVLIIVNTIIWVLVLTSAVVLTVGFGKFCSWTATALAKEGVDLGSCANAQDLDWSEFVIIRGESAGVKGENFYTLLIIACIADWILLALWTFQWSLNFSQSFTMCSCEIAEEKRPVDKTMLIAQRRSRMATPIGTPGNWTPGGRYPPSMGAPSVASGPPARQGFPQQQYPQPHPQQQQPYRPVSQQPQQYRPPPQQQYRPPPPRQYLEQAPPMKSSQA